MDPFTLHPYYRTSWCATPESPGEQLDASIRVINDYGKPALVTECCKGSLDDEERAESVRVSLAVGEHLGSVLRVGSLTVNVWVKATKRSLAKSH